MPLLKNFLKGNVGDYNNIEVEWHSGHKPTAYFKESKDGETIEEVKLPNYKGNDIMNFFNEHNFLPKESYSGEVFKTFEFGGHFYELYNQGTRFKAARLFAVEKGAYLLTIQSEDEHTQVADMLPNDMNLIWLGATHGSENEWTWDGGSEKNIVFYPATVDGESHFSKWNEGEPNNFENKEDCAALTQSGWNDVPCDWRLSFILEYNEKPLTIDVSTRIPKADEESLQNEKQSMHSDL